MLWKKCDPWLGSTFMPGSVDSTIVRAPGDLAPLHRDAQRGVGAAPAAEPDQQVGPARLQQLPVEDLELGRDLPRPHRVEAVRLHVDDVADRRLGPVPHGPAGDGQHPLSLRSPGRSMVTVWSETTMGRIWRNPKRAGSPRLSGSVMANSISTFSPRASSAVRRSARIRALTGHSSTVQEGSEVEEPRPGGPRPDDQPVRFGVVGGGDVAQRPVLLGLGDARLAAGTRSR